MKVRDPLPIDEQEKFIIHGAIVASTLEVEDNK